MEKCQLFYKNHGLTPLGKCKFYSFLNRRFYSIKKVSVYFYNFTKHFFHPFCIKTKDRKIPSLPKNHGQTRLEKCKIGGFFKSMFLQSGTTSFPLPNFTNFTNSRVYSLPHYASKNADWNQLTTTNWWRHFGQSKRRKSFVLFPIQSERSPDSGFFTCDPTKKCIIPSSREGHKGLIGRGHDLRL